MDVDVQETVGSDQLGHHLSALNLPQVELISNYEVNSSDCSSHYEWDIEDMTDSPKTEGVIVEEVELQVQVKCFGCDRPARSFLKAIVNHGGYYACERCWVEGIDYKDRRVYPFRNEEKTTDESFRLKLNQCHHRGTSPLVKVRPSLNLVILFILEIMHFLYLGNMKKFLEKWFPSDTKKTRGMITRISLRLVNLASQTPVDFQRSTRTLSDISKWTANKFTFFLLYCGPSVLKDILDEELYNHFMLLHVACRILCSRDYSKKYLPYAKDYLEGFVLLSEELYGLEFITLYIHHLVHLHEDVENMDLPLSDVTANSFKNLLGILKRFIRSGSKPFVQIRKMVERDLEFK
ncbi:hypothetical protein QAD02_017591 [Eretmocerus hayati]|uniref:Uncharacterized protein n=1 Tax=Eretmocerus hayati TaxID=131215 RepID=A0ACC2PGT8_9HYME|nr:hypothetical protein QAD02_017591 [Eretmocerus hayati]